MAGAKIRIQNKKRLDRPKLKRLVSGIPKPFIFYHIERKNGMTIEKQEALRIALKVIIIAAIYIALSLYVLVAWSDTHARVNQGGYAIENHK